MAPLADARTRPRRPGRLPGTAGVQLRQQSAVTCQAWAKASRSTVAAASGGHGDRRAAGEGLHHALHQSLADREVEAGGPLERPGEQVVPDDGAPNTKTGCRTLRPFTTRMCGRGAWAEALTGRVRPSPAPVPGSRPAAPRDGGPRSRGRAARGRRPGLARPAAAVRAGVAVQVERGLDERHVAERLRGVADLPLVPGVVLLAEQARRRCAGPSSRSNSSAASSSRPIMCSALTSQKLQARNAPSLPGRPSELLPGRRCGVGQLVAAHQAVGASARA